MARRRNIRGRKKTLKGNRPNTPGGPITDLTVCILAGAPTSTTWICQVVKQDVAEPAPGTAIVEIIASEITDLEKWGCWSDSGFSPATTVVPLQGGTIEIIISPPATGLATMIIPPFHPSLRSLNGATCAGGGVNFVF